MKKIILIFCCWVNAVYAENGCMDGFVPLNVYSEHLNPTDAGDCGAAGLFSAPGVYVVQDNFCGAGYYMSANGCVAYDTVSDCPTDYYVPSNSIVRANVNGTCETGTPILQDIGICADKVGGVSDYICTSQMACTGATRLRTSNGISLPVWADKLTVPSLAFGFDDGSVCYMNLLTGSGGFNIMTPENVVYHGVE